MMFVFYVLSVPNSQFHDCFINLLVDHKKSCRFLFFAKYPKHAVTCFTLPTNYTANTQPVPEMQKHQKIVETD